MATVPSFCIVREWVIQTSLRQALTFTLLQFLNALSSDEQGLCQEITGLAFQSFGSEWGILHFLP